MTTTFSVSNSTIGASRSITMTDADTMRLATALNATRYAGQGLTAAQAVTHYLRDLLGDTIALVDQYEQSAAQPAQITLTG